MSEKEAASNRRDFLKLATVGATGAAATAVAGTAEAAEEVKTELGYSKTEHVKAYLESARF
jgi:hypothetical protein